MPVVFVETKYTTIKYKHNSKLTDLYHVMAKIKLCACALMLNHAQQMCTVPSLGKRQHYRKC